ncbi:hypothetical protein [Pelagicoccus sp. SDUM812005]|uniref:CAF17-like 4Fe-4S cluster assembly/insertion protein YgfZ n=1 Tax=Pelagicoccus sp. SDUM812005 TaxID=3041257 RepID=UPI0028105D16|nr:hypothetical protein [Pelagicoccus sp. SDUM812005]MDQ8179913.1 hypothetical protein [Pelagicoccus sp. SDUM812005]
MPRSRYFKYQAGAQLSVCGPDAQEFLQGQFSNDLSAMTVDQVVYGLWLNRKGKIVADSFVLRRGEDQFVLLSYFCGTAAIHERLDAYLIMEDAELEAASEGPRGISVWGEAAQARACAALGIELPSEGAFCEGQGPVVAFWGRRGAEPVLEILFLEGKGGAEARIEDVDACLAELGAEALSEDELAALAIEGKTPQIGRGFGELDLPQELGLEVDAVSFRKGCYLGQEVMARLHAMGRVRKGLRIVGIEDPTTFSQAELPVDLLDDAGKRQGQLRSVAYSKFGGVGLAVVSSGFDGACLRAGEVEVSLRREGDASDD